MLVTSEHGPATIYLAVSHSVWWQSFVVRISPSGKSEVVFVSSGNVRSLRRLRTSRGDFILAGGINNEHGQASLAVLEQGAPPSTSPQREPRFQCTQGCPRARPYRFILLPRSELAAASDRPYNIAANIPVRADGFTVETDETAGWKRCHVMISPTIFGPSGSIERRVRAISYEVREGRPDQAHLRKLPRTQEARNYSNLR